VGLLMHVRPHPDDLVALLCDQLARPPDDPFAAELVAVPTRGIERWLTQQIASGLAERGAGEGICANVGFPSPSRLVRRALRAVPELDAAMTSWEGPALTARLLSAIDQSIAEPWMALLARHIAPDGVDPSPRRLAAAGKINRLFSRYARRRPAMIRRWGAGDDVGPSGEILPDDWRWQPRLWRLLRGEVGVASLSELVPAALDPIRRGAVEVDLPDRFSVYGLTSTDPLDLEVLIALSAHRQVNLYILHPSPALWTQADQLPRQTPLPTRTHDPVARLVQHPLLQAWGRDSRELQTVLGDRSVTTGEIPSPPSPPTTMLGHLQEDIRHNRPPLAIPSGVDRSIQIHVCHGPRRQAEVMRDALLHILAADPSLEPRDVVIMTPDLATFAPLLEAAFPQGDTGGLPDLRLRIADRSLAATNPLVGFAAQLVAIADSRLEADAVRELVTRPLVQNRFGFDADTAGEIVAVIDDAKIAWGVDAGDRQRWGVGDLQERTWRRGLDRALTGVFYSDSPVRTVGDIAPLHGIEGQDAGPAGLLAALVDRLVAVRERLSTPMPLTAWAGAIAAAVRTLAAPAWGDEWQLDQLERLLAETFPPGAEAATDVPLVSLPEVRAALAAWTDDRPSPLFFRTGDVTVCTLAPMRSVPYRVVCLLGMDDTRFPRRGRVDGDDLLADHEIIGDYDPAAADRQLLLDAVMAAGDNLVLTYSGRDQLTSARFPPAVPIAELQDTLATMVGPESLEEIVTNHPLQSFSANNFTPAALIPNGPWGFDPMQHRGAVAVGGRATQFQQAPVSWPDPPDYQSIRLGDLISFLQDPPGRFLRTRLGFTVPKAGEIPDDTLPVDLRGLGKWALTERILTGLIAGHDPAALSAAQRAGDALPPGDLGIDDLEDSAEIATRLWDAAQEMGYDPRRHQPWSGVVEADGLVVEGTVIADPQRHHLVTITPSRLGHRPRLKAFAELVFLSAVQPEVPWQAALLGKRDRGNGFVFVTLAALPGPDRRAHAIELLGGLVDLYVEGHRRPLPLPAETGYLWQRNGGLKSDKARHQAKDKFEDRFGDSNDPAYRLVLPHLSSWGALEASHFVDYSAALWLPILSLCRERNL